MYIVVRQYAAAGELGDLLATRSDEVRDLIGGVPGFVSYYAVRDGDKLMSITVCNDRAGTDESNRIAAAWVKENLPSTTMSAPTVGQGEVFLNFT